MKNSILFALLLNAGIVSAHAEPLKFYLARPVGSLSPSDAKEIIPTGKGTAAAEWNVSTSTISAEYGESALKTFTLTNKGTLPISNLVLHWEEGSINTQDCGTSLAPGQSCLVSVTANSLQSGSRTSSLTFNGTTTKGALSGSVSVGISIANPLSALSIDTPSATLAGNIGSKQTRTFTLTNSNGKAVRLDNVSFSNGVISSTTCADSINANSSCSITVETTIETEGTTEGSLAINYQASGAKVLSIPVYVAGTYVWSALSADKSTIALQGNVGTSGSSTITLTNPNSKPVTLTAPQFVAGTVSTTCGASLSANASCTVTISSNYASEGTTNSNLQIGYTTDTSSTMTIPVSITGTDPYANLVGLKLNIDSLSSSYTDSTGNVLTPFGPALTTMAGAGSDTSSPVYNGSNGLITPQNSKWWLGSQFTVEAWINPVAGPGGQIIGIHQYGVACNWMLYSTISGTLIFHWGNSTQYSSAPGVITPGQWQKVIASKGADDKLKLFVNGVKVMETTVAGAPPVNNPGLSVTIGNDTVGTFGFRGAIDDIRITNGVGRY